MKLTHFFLYVVSKNKGSNDSNVNKRINLTEKRNSSIPQKGKHNKQVESHGVGPFLIEIMINHCWKRPQLEHWLLDITIQEKYQLRSRGMLTYGTGVCLCMIDYQNYLHAVVIPKNIGKGIQKYAGSIYIYHKGETHIRENIKRS